MKKVLSWILCAALLLTSVAGLAEEVPSMGADAAAAAGALVDVITFEDGV